MRCFARLACCALCWWLPSGRGARMPISPLHRTYYSTWLSLMFTPGRHPFSLTRSLGIGTPHRSLRPFTFFPAPGSRCGFTWSPRCTSIWCLNLLAPLSVNAVGRQCVWLALEIVLDIFPEFSSSSASLINQMLPASRFHIGFHVLRGPSPPPLIECRGLEAPPYGAA